MRGTVASGSFLYADESPSYNGMDEYAQASVVHSRGEYVDGDVHINGIESFWARLKRAHKGVYHKMSPKHLHRYVADFAGRHNIRDTPRTRTHATPVSHRVGYLAHSRPTSAPQSHVDFSQFAHDRRPLSAGADEVRRGALPTAAGPTKGRADPDAPPVGQHYRFGTRDRRIRSQSKSSGGTGRSASSSRSRFI